MRFRLLQFSGSILRLRTRVIVALICAIAVAAAPPQKKKKEEETQVLQIPKELPAAVSADPRRMTFHVTPLSNKGLLSQQIRDALKAAARETGADTVVKIRAFVAGSGDLRRVRDLVSEVFTDRRQPLPALSLVQSGGLPLEGAQVILEVTAAGRKDVNPNGLAYISAQVQSSDNPLDPVGPLAEKSVASLRQAVKATGVEPADVLRVSCFLSSLEHLAEIRKMVDAEYPRAALNYLQTQRAPGAAVAACEAVARLRSTPSATLQFLNPEQLPAPAGQSQIALVNASQVVLTGSQVSFGYQEQDSKLALGRLGKVLEQAGSSPRNVAFVHYYPLSSGMAAQVRKVRTDFFDSGRPPAASLLVFEGLPSMDAGFGVDVIAVK